MFHCLSLLALTLGLLLAAPPARACDICGCSAASHNIGVMPLFSRHFAGFRYQYRHFNSGHRTLTGQISEPSQEYFHSVDFRLRYQVHSRVQLFAQLPYHVYSQKSTGGDLFSNRGVGDALLLANLVLFNNGDSLHLPLRHALQAGAGLKLPTGYWQKASTMNPNLQLGSDSWDLPLHLSYTLRHRHRWGMQTELNYRYQTRNREGLRMGNIFAADYTVFYGATAGAWTFMPMLGVNYLNLQDNRQDGSRIRNTGGHLLTAQAAGQLFFKKWMLGFSAKLPLVQSLAGGDSRNTVQYQAQVLFFW